MNRRGFHLASISALSLCVALAHRDAFALTLGELTNAEASKGLKLALETGALAAINILGRKDGFLSNDRVRIPLPGFLKDPADVLRALGQGGRVDELITAMNRGAEQSVPVAKELLFQAVRTMTVMDAKSILNGGDNAVTQFFAKKTRPALAAKFLPMVTQATRKIDLVPKYKVLAEQLARLGLLKKEDASVEEYVTERTLDGLYLVISDEEKKIRENPAGYGSALLTKVFGVIK